MKTATPDTLRPASFWWGVSALACVATLSCRGATASDFSGFLLLTATALLPAGLWCHRRAHGLPLYPIFTLGTIPTFALPLIDADPLATEYGPGARFHAALILAMTNLLGALPWFLLTRRRRTFSGACLKMRRRIAPLLFPSILVATIFFNLAQRQLADAVPSPALSILRAAVIALSNLSVYILAYRWGGGGLTLLRRLTVATLILATVLSTLPSALMVGALGYAVMALVGFALGRGGVPWIPLALLTAAALFLQGGKEQLRDKYWYGADAAPLGLADAPGLLADWIQFSVDALSPPDEPTSAAVTVNPSTSSQTLLQRAGLLQLFLRVREMSPEPLPYLHGRTYTIVPALLVPRVIDPKKERAHLGTYMLAIRYGLQTSDDTLTTTIGFGLINEALANFGPAGCLALAVGLGCFYGVITRWSEGYPLLSLRRLLAVLVLSVAFQNEFTAGVYLTTLFQGGCILLAFALVTMHRGRSAAAAPHPALAGAVA